MATMEKEIPPELLWRFVCFVQLRALVERYGHLLKYAAAYPAESPHDGFRRYVEILRENTQKMGLTLKHVWTLMPEGAMRKRVGNLSHDIHGLLDELAHLPTEQSIGGYRRSARTRKRIEIYVSHMRVALEERYFADIPDIVRLMQAFEETTRK
ncbi:hypothetical protein A3B35_01035 [Candidatus Kaiserbacteria bacterium RIFCSPLOWO2_01_FULL_54_24]|uniref:Uncharacterized protein n=1 Tax=Candidatus Kaiserbacteria bacterium RIFCSPLOWO2_01_FULL_54_24 TaxID=1798515 RepID=A0A1F6EVE1_9BACT|nr:MAG: hypothetical protein A3B35_01035 [Candidatus Kaiserbacteria bacterium RIFCSPLOWO2_01_FULL_54_24]